MSTQEATPAPVTPATVRNKSQQMSSESSGRTSMPPPPPPQNTSLPSSPRPPTAAMERSVSSSGQGQLPLRHPRPMNAADLHLEMEKEQESMVNRLTRELSALRAQTASVASTASSTSDLFTSTQAPPDYHYLSGSGTSIIPTSARRHRSSSNLSNRSARSAREAITRDATATSVSGVAAPRDTVDRSHSHQTSGRQSLDIQRPETSRQNSYGLGLTTSTSSGNAGNIYRSTSNATSPYGPPAGYGYIPHRSSTSASHSRDPSSQQESRSPASRYEEAAAQKQELEATRKENEALRQRIRDLERQLASTSTDNRILNENPTS